MKNRIILCLSLLICLFEIGCKKEIANNNESVNNLFTDSVPTVKNNEPLLLSFSNGNNATIVQWQVFPNANYSISKVGIYATFTFRKAGVYSIVATANSVKATYIVTVLDSVFNAIDTGFNLSASKLVNVLPSEIDSFTVKNPPSPSSFIWTTSGNISYVNTASNPAIFSFGSGKTASIQVKVGNQIRSRTIWLSDPSNHNTSLDTVPFIFSDKLNITPSVSKDLNGNKILVLTAQTGYNYTSTSDLVLSQLDSSNNQFTVSYGGVVMAKVPSADVKPASCMSTISMKEGSFPFVINYGNHTYIGTIELSATGIYTFAWAKNNEVSINPLTVH